MLGLMGLAQKTHVSLAMLPKGTHDSLIVPVTIQQSGAVALDCFATIVSTRFDP